MAGFGQESLSELNPSVDLMRDPGKNSSSKIGLSIENLRNESPSKLDSLFKTIGDHGQTGLSNFSLSTEIVIDPKTGEDPAQQKEAVKSHHFHKRKWTG